MIALLEMLKCTPICQVYASDCEGDDIVAFLCKGPFKEVSKVIVSSDKDLYQLLDKHTSIYSLHKKKVLSELDVFEEFRIKTKNFALAKAICGDPGDNIPGIKGLGFKTIAKKLPFLGLDEEILPQDLISFCHQHAPESITYRKILEEKAMIDRNWQLVHLDGGMLSHNQISKVQNAIDTFAPKVNRIGLIKALVKEGISGFDVEEFFYAFNCVDKVGHSTGEQHAR